MGITLVISCAQLSALSPGLLRALRVIPDEFKVIHIVIPNFRGVIPNLGAALSIEHRKLDRKRWGAVRRLALVRDGYRCVKCNKAGRLEVDHVKPLSKGGDPWNMDNLQTLCRGCHIAKTRSEQPKQPSPAVTKWGKLVEDLNE